MQVLLGLFIVVVIVVAVFHVDVGTAVAIIAVSAFLTIGLLAIMKRAQVTARRKALLEKYHDDAIVDRILSRSVWEGMTRDQIVDALGAPSTIDNGMQRRKVLQVFKYHPDGVDRYRLRVNLEDGVVTGWQQRG
jgi:outer membrane protein assembly factor BamE (lipoprotein component of BamABCDE complex)